MLPGFYLRRNIPVTNGKELNLTAYRICTQYYNGLQGEVKKQSGKRRKEN
jgi:hypothetical protein